VSLLWRLKRRPYRPGAVGDRRARIPPAPVAGEPNERPAAPRPAFGLPARGRTGGAGRRRRRPDVRRVRRSRGRGRPLDVPTATAPAVTAAPSRLPGGRVHRPRAGPDALRYARAHGRRRGRSPARSHGLHDPPGSGRSRADRSRARAPDTGEPGTGIRTGGRIRPGGLPVADTGTTGPLGSPCGTATRVRPGRSLGGGFEVRPSVERAAGAAARPAGSYGRGRRASTWRSPRATDWRMRSTDHASVPW